MDRHIHTSQLCIKIFANKHGKNYSKFIHSRQTFEKLCRVLKKIHLFTYTDHTCCYRIRCQAHADILSFCEYVVDDVEIQVLQAIIRKIMKSKNKRMIRRLAKLESHVDFGSDSEEDDNKDDLINDLKYLRIIVEYVLKRKINQGDYSDFGIRVNALFKKDHINEAAGACFEYIIMKCDSMNL